MDAHKPVEGFIPEGLVVSNLHGEAGAILTISGVVERSDIKLKQLIIASSGKMKNGSVEANHVVINGSADGVVFRVDRLQVSETARISNCVIEIKDATGFSMHEKACFDGDIKLTTRPEIVSSLWHSAESAEGFSPLVSVNQIDHADIEADIPLGD